MSEDEPEVGRLRLGDLTIDYDRRRVVRGDEEIRLTPKEFELLALLARSADRVLTHRAILKAIWGPNAVDNPEHLWVLMGQLRKKFEPDPSHPRYLLSEPWVGCRFSTEPPDRLTLTSRSEDLRYNSSSAGLQTAGKCSDGSSDPPEAVAQSRSSSPVRIR